MQTQTAASLHFQRKITEFCNLRIAPLVPNQTLDNIRPYLTHLITCRKRPPKKRNGIDWQTISDSCCLDGEMTDALKRNLQSGLEAIGRWVESEEARSIARAAPAGRQTATLVRKRPANAVKGGRTATVR
ncbi:hypothetical protein FJU08_17885 [Martelella alba]|uniref:Uncharacterized protein n=1 Tax=Martelella alba TaxID=2590451 RepID=A0A506U361_9HYPH|nr:hypothetical protein [Martelella alba]TPW28250.1 hypothetical protein FJU08_17885 [Martelella alba]